MRAKPLLCLVLTTAFAGFLQGCVPALVIGGAATTAAVVHDRRTAGSIVDDQGIEFKALAALRSDEDLYRQAHINVTSYNSIVLLTGEAPTEALRNRALELVRPIDRVRSVHNEIRIAAPSSLTSRASDTLLTGKVKASLVGAENIDATRVKVVTEAGVVYLMGLVTRTEADAASDIASRVSGVQRVIKIFEYIG